MKSFIASNRVAALFVANTLLSLKHNLLSITTTSRPKLEDCYVSVVTDTWSEDIEKILDQIYSDAVSSTLNVVIPAG